MYIRKVTAVIMAALLIASFSGCRSENDGSDVSGEPVLLLDTSGMFSGSDLESGYDGSECTVITLKDGTAEINGKGASAEGGTVTVSSEGEYLISGSLDGGTIVVDADKGDKVRLILNGVSITGIDCAAVLVRQADKVFITLARGSQNTLANRSGAKSTDEADAVIFSRDDLTINGEGSLTVNAHTGHAVVSKDDLVIAGGSYTVTSEKKAFDANDSIRIAGGTFTVDSGTDAFHCESDDASKGYIYIADGKFTVTSGTDGMDASGVVQIDNGTFAITTGGGSSNASTKKGGGINGDWGNWGGGGRHMSSADAESHAVTDLSASSGTEGQPSDKSSAKGLKSDSSVAINNGSLTIDSSDDAIHSDAQVSIAEGEITISSGDDGIHAGSLLKISGGTVSISKSYEGLEGKKIEISGGSISVTASDDGLNAAGGNDRSSVSGRPGQNEFAAQEGVYINISGGVITVNASGDGIDSNGDLTVSGGEVYVSGSTNNGNSALDFNGSATVTGGVVIAAGMSGMAQNFGGNSTQGSMLVSVNSQSGGSEIILRDSSGRVLALFKPEKSYNCVLVSTPEVKKGETYTLTTGSDTASVRMDSLIYGEEGMGGFGGGGMPGGNLPGGNQPGGRGRRRG